MAAEIGSYVQFNTDPYGTADRLDPAEQDRPVAVTVFGLPVPNAGPVFLAALAVHVIAGLVCVIC
ncbi:hypothetical protein ABZ260_51295, partial [Streptosporangium sp. NPDC006013]|uniref:hypothetical protein n=1 Tax=Streptosporangium sp. NPDC006013 TaxID=3155596 RepID=UPI00339FA6EE